MSTSNKLYQQIKDAVENMTSKVTLSKNYNEQDVRLAFRHVIRDNPQYFWYAYRYNYIPSESLIKISYSFSLEKVAFFKEQIASVIEKDFRIDYVRKLSSLDKIRYIYEWIIRYTNYNTESAYNQTIVSVFVNRNSVCTGYAKATQYLCQLLGIECRLVFGRFHNDKEKGRHCWNLVNLNNSWYHLDLCLGDPSIVKNILHKPIIDACQDKTILFDNFCVSTEKILETRIIEDIDHLPECSKSINIIPDVELQPTTRTSNLGCQVSTVGTTSKIYLDIDDKHKVIKAVEGKDWQRLVDNERNCYTALSECPYILRYYGGTNNRIILEQATPLTDLMQSHYYKPTANSVIKLVTDIAKVVKYCFDHGFAYRDIHIGNIYRRSDRTWILGDFGHCVPITSDNTYLDVVGHSRFVPQTAIANGLFDRSSAIYSLIRILEYLIDEYKLSLSNISERIANGLKENKTKEPLDTLINVLTNGCEEVPPEFCDKSDVCNCQTDIIFTNDNH